MIRYLLIFPLLIFISCNGNLSEGEAEKCIKDVGVFPAENFEGFKLSYNPHDSDSYFYKNHKKLFALGILKNLKIKIKEDSSLIAVSLTSFGRKYLSKRNPYNNDSTAVFLNLCNIHFISVDSVITDQDNKNATAYAKFKLTDITPIGKYVFAMYENMYKIDRIAFEKRNDKWIIVL